MNATGDAAHLLSCPIVKLFSVAGCGVTAMLPFRRTICDRFSTRLQWITPGHSFFPSGTEETRSRKAPPVTSPCLLITRVYTRVISVGRLPIPAYCKLRALHVQYSVSELYQSEVHVVVPVVCKICHFTRVAPM